MKLTDLPKKLREELMCDDFIFGCAFCLKKDGKYERIDPMKVKIKYDEKGYMIGIDYAKGKDKTVTFRTNRKTGRTYNPSRPSYLREK